MRPNEGPHQLETVEGGMNQDTEIKRSGERHSRAGNYRGRDESGHRLGKKASEQEKEERKLLIVVTLVTCCIQTVFLSITRQLRPT